MSRCGTCTWQVCRKGLYNKHDFKVMVHKCFIILFLTMTVLQSRCYQPLLGAISTLQTSEKRCLVTGKSFSPSYLCCVICLLICWCTYRPGIEICCSDRLVSVCLQVLPNTTFSGLCLFAKGQKDK